DRHAVTAHTAPASKCPTRAATNIRRIADSARAPTSSPRSPTSAPCLLSDVSTIRPARLQRQPHTIGRPPAGRTRCWDQRGYARFDFVPDVGWHRSARTAQPDTVHHASTAPKRWHVVAGSWHGSNVSNVFKQRSFTVYG